MVVIHPGESVQRIVLEHPSCARVFDHHGIDYCRGGLDSLAETCRRHGLDAGRVGLELEAVVAETADALPPSSALATPELIEAIVVGYHVHLRELLPHLRSLAARVAAAHGDRAPDLLALDAELRRLADDLELHLEDEEDLLFPALLGEDVATVERLLVLIEHEDFETRHRLRQLRRLAADYQPPSWACPAHRALFAELATLERELIEHAELESTELVTRLRGARTQEHP
ncbi:MAG: DUF542 domain-containing protein [Kofleriaceae bacterium]|nr:DUF542 domain-containing protein [Kofleriaceae bacterium]